MITKSDYVKYFPFNKIRKSQEKAITFILNSFLVNNKNYVVLEAGFHHQPKVFFLNSF